MVLILCKAIMILSVVSLVGLLFLHYYDFLRG